MKQRGAALAVKNVNAIAASDYPTKAIRPLNSRLDERRLRDLFGIHMPSWKEALDIELNTMFWEYKGDAQ
jgi:dTDP-4-dehydrorhamnose reductase